MRSQKQYYQSKFAYAYMTPIPTAPQPVTLWDAMFSKPPKLLTSLALQINNNPVTDEQLIRLAGCPNGGEVYASSSADAILLESRHPSLILNPNRNANFVEIRRRGTQYYLYLDYIWFSEDCPKGFGAVVLLNMAYMALQLGFSHIELLAAGGTGIKGSDWTEKFWGFETWPRLGFDTELQPPILALTANEPHLNGLTHLSQLIEVDLPWWKKNGDGWDMEFNLTPGSQSWDTLYKFCNTRGLLI